MTAKKGTATKIIIGVLLVVIVCMGAYIIHMNGSNTEQAENPPAESSTPEVTETPEAEPTPEIEVAPEPTPEVEVAPEPESLSVSNAAEPGDPEFQGYTQTERYAVYEDEYQMCGRFSDVYASLEARIQGEIGGAAHQLYTIKGLETPEGHESEYRAWRDEFHPVENEKAPSASANEDKKIDLGNYYTGTMEDGTTTEIQIQSQPSGDTSDIDIGTPTPLNPSVPPANIPVNTGAPNLKENNAVQDDYEIDISDLKNHG